MSKNARSRIWSRWLSRKPAAELPARSLAVETLEDRLAPATFTWDGGGANALWSTGTNWVGDSGPAQALPGTVLDLVFPAGAARPGNQNDLATDTVINSITVQGQGVVAGVNTPYTISQAPDPAVNSIILGNGSPSSGNFTVQPNAGTVTFALPTTLATNGDQSVSVGGTGSVLSITAPLTGSALNNLNKDGVGQMNLTTANPNLLGGVKVNGGILQIRNTLALGPVGSPETVVGPLGSLYLNTVVAAPGQATIGETLRLNGGGTDTAKGALFLEAGNATWSGQVILETGITSPPQAGGPGTVIGAATDLSLNITGVVTDSGAGMGLVKEGGGEVKLGSQAGNTYRGQTNVNHGILTVTHPLSLGDSRFGSGATQVPAFGTVVNVSPGRAGQLRMEAPAGSPGFTIVGEHLTLNGDGPQNAFPSLPNVPLGSLHNNRGNNTWAGSVVLGSAAPDGANVTIGVDPATTGPAVPSSLTISGVVSAAARPSTTLTKQLAGRLILTNNNTYTAATIIANGALTIRDSQALGPANGAGGTTVNRGGSLELDVEAAYATSVLPQFDDLLRDTWLDSVTGSSPHRLEVKETLTLNGRGLNATAVGTGITNFQGTGGTGALNSVGGINSWVATITLASGDAAIGVQLDGSRPSISGTTSRVGHPLPDSSYFRDDYSLTIQDATSVGAVGILGTRSTDFVKRGEGHLILPQANPYLGRTLIEQGWVTVQNNRALGDLTPRTDLGKTAQQPTIVSAGASLHLFPTNTSGNLTLLEDNIILEGIGIGSNVGQEQHPYALINQKGALLNLGGDNTIVADVGLISTGYGTAAERGAGIGVERAAAVESPPGSNNFVLLTDSRLTITGDLSDGARYQQSLDESVTVTPAGTRVYNVGATRGRVSVPYHFNPNNPPGTPTVDRLQIFYPDASTPANLIYDTGDVFFTGGPGAVTGPGLATVNFGSATSTGTTVVVVLSQSGAPVDWQYGVADIGDTPRGSYTQFPSSLVKLGSQTLQLWGAGSYSGKKSEIREGTLRAQNDTTFGRATFGTEITQQIYPVTETEVKSGATLEITGSVAQHSGGVAAGLNVQDERLTLNEYGLQFNIAGQPTARFRIDFGGQQTVQLQVPRGYTGAVPYAQYLQDAINEPNKPNPADRFVFRIGEQITTGPNGALPGAAPGDVQALVTEIRPGVYTITFPNTARFYDIDASALSVVIDPIGTPLAENPASFVASRAEVVYTVSNAPLSVLSDDSGWRGPVTLNSGTRIAVNANSRLALLGDILEGGPALSPGSDLVKRGIGDLTLGGAASDYRGVTYIDSGIVTAVSSRAFGAASTGTANSVGVTPGGTVVDRFAQLQIQGSLTIAGEALAVRGDGSPTLPSLDSTIRWLNFGPGATNNGAVANTSGIGAPTSARVDGITTDPTDPRVIYITTAGGGAWKTKDGGLTWMPLFDLAVDAVNNELALPSDTTLASVAAPLPRSAMMFGGSIAVAPSNPQVVYYATGDSNGVTNGIPNPNFNAVDNYAGSGVYRSQDGGKTWVRLLANNGTNPLYGQAVTKLIVDPFFASRIYVASGTIRPAAAGATNVNNASLTAFAGVWRWTGNGVGNEGWVNLTTIASPGRSAAGQAPWDAANGNGPGNAGPDNDFRFRFPTGQANTAEAATWSDIALVVRFDSPNPANVKYTLYAALGESATAGVLPATLTRTSQIVRTGVFFTEDPDKVGAAAAGAGVAWWSARGTLYPIPAHTTDMTSDVDRRGTDGFPLGATDVNRHRNGYIKLTAATQFQGTDNSNNGPGAGPRGISGRLLYPTIVVYASVAKPEGDTGGRDGEFLEVRRSFGTGTSLAGWDWGNPISDGSLNTAFGIPYNIGTTNTRTALGRYNHTLQVSDGDPRTLRDNNLDEVILGGLDSMFRTVQGTNPGVMWNRLVADDRGFYPADQFHALHYDASGRLLIGTDAGLWRWDRLRYSNLNSNLPVIEFNSVDPHPTDFRQAVGGASNTGTQVWTGVNTVSPTEGVIGPVWQRVDDLSTTVSSPLSGGGTDPTTGSVSGQVRYDPFNPTVMYAVRDGVLRKFDPAVSPNWVTLDPLSTFANGFTAGDNLSFTAPANGSNLAYDQFPLVVDPLTPNRLLIGGRVLLNGVFVRNVLLESLDGGATWIDLNSGMQPFLPLPGTDLLNASVPPVPPGFGQPRVIALAGRQGEFRADGRFPTVTEGLTDTADRRTIYVSDGTNIVVTKNRGGSYANTGFPLPAGGTVTDIVVNPVNRDEVYVTVSVRPGTPGGRIWRSLDAGQSWTDLTGGYDPDATTANITGTNPNQGPLPNIPTWKAAIDPRTGTLYVGTDDGVWVLIDPKAADQGNVARTADPAARPVPYPPTTPPATLRDMFMHWRRLGDGMPNVQVRDLVINQTTSTLTAGTHGRGAFQMFLPNYAADSGAVRAVSGQSRWTGPVVLTGDTRIGAVGTQQIQNGLSAAVIDFGGTISSLGNAPFVLEKVGRGTVILSGANTYTGVTDITEGVLEVKDPNALGAPTGNTVVRYGAALQVRSDIEAEPITINGDGIRFNGHATGAIRNVSGNNTYNGVLTLGTESTTGLPMDPERDLRQVTVGADSGSSLKIGQNPTGQNPGLIGRVQGVTDKILTLQISGGRNWDQITATGTAAGALTAVTTQDGASAAVPEIQQIAVPLAAGMVTITSPEFGAIGTFDPTSPTFATDVAAAIQTRYRLGRVAPAPAIPPDPTLTVTVDDARVGIDKEQTGTLILASDNTAYLGLTRVLTGSLEVRDAQALGPVAGSAPTRVSDGAAVRIANNAPNTPTVVTAESLFLSGTGTPDGVGGSGTGALRNTGGDNTWAGPIQLTDIPNFAPTTNPGHQVAFGTSNLADTLTVAPVAGITEDFATYGQFGVIKVGPGVLRLTTANQYTGVTNINEGTVRAADNAALGVNTTSSEVQTIRVFGTGGYQLTVNGSPTVGLVSAPAGVSSTDAQVQTAIENVVAGSGLTVFVSSTPNSNGRVYTVTFIGRYAGQNVPVLGATGVASGVSVVIATPQEGGLGTVVASGASLELDGTGIAVAETLTIAGQGVTDASGYRQGALGNRGGLNFFSGTVTVGVDPTGASVGAQAGSQLQLTGRVLGQVKDPTATPNSVTAATAELTKVGHGTVAFVGDKEYRGRTQVAEGALQIDTANGLGVGRNEVQRLRVTGTFDDAGTATVDEGEKYTVTLFGETTDTIRLRPGAAGALALFTALTSPRTGGNLPILTAADVSVVADTSIPAPTGGEAGEAVFIVTFMGRLANTNVPLLTDISPTTPDGPSPVPVQVDTPTQGQPAGAGAGTNEVQTFIIPRQGGQFTLTGSLPAGAPFTIVNNQDFDIPLTDTTVPIDTNLKDLFDARYGAGNTFLVETTLPGNNGRLITVFFQGALTNQNIPQITGSFSPRLRVRAEAVEEGVGREAQLVTVRNASGLQYTLSYVNPFTGQLVNGTRLLGANATQAQFQAALNDTIGIGGLGMGAAFGYLGTGSAIVTRTVSTGGFQYLIQFGGALANVNVLPITVSIVNGGATITTETLGDGAEGTVVAAGAAVNIATGSALTVDDERLTINGGGRREVQTITPTRSGAAAGTYTLQYTDPVTGLLVVGTRVLTVGDALGTTASSTAAEFAAALTDPVAAGGLGLGAGNVAVTRSDTPGAPVYTIVFTGTLTGVNFATLLAAVGTGTASVTTGVRENGGGGALRLLDSTGNSTVVWGDPVTGAPLILGSNASIGVQSDTDVLRLVLPTTDRNPLSVPTAERGPTLVRGPNQGFSLTKVGEGSLEFNAAGDNDYTGFTFVNNGTLILNHTGAGSHDAVRNELIVGDRINLTETGPAVPLEQSAVVRLSNSDQIANTPTVTVNADGLLDLHGWVETIGVLNINGGVVDTQRPSIPAFPAVPAGVSVPGPELTTGTVTMNDGRFVVRGGDEALTGTITATNTAEVIVVANGGLTSGAIDLTGSSLSVGDNATADTQGATITARRGPAPGSVRSTITTGTGATLNTVNGGTRGTVTLTDSDLTTGTNSQTTIGTLTLNKDTTLPATGSTATIGAGATLNTGGADIFVNESDLTTLTGAVVNPTSPEGRLVATGTAGDRSTVVFGPTTDANFLSVALTLTDLDVRANATLDTTGTTAPDWGVTMTDATADFAANSALTTAAGGLTLTRSQLLGSVGVDITTQAVQLLDGSTLALGNGPSATLETNGQTVTVNESTFTTGTGAVVNPTSPAGALNAAGTAARRSTVGFGDNSTSTFASTTLGLTDLTTGAGATLNAGTVLATDSTVGTGANSFTNAAAVTLTDSNLTFGAGSTNALTGALTTLDTPATADDGNVTFGSGSSTTATGVSATNAAVLLQDGAAVTAGPLTLSNATLTLDPSAAAPHSTLAATTASLTQSTAALGTNAVLSASGAVSVGASANGSTVSGVGTFQLTGPADQTVTVADGAADEDFTVSSGLTQTNGQTVVKAGPGRLTLAPDSGETTLTTLLRVTAGDVQVNTLTGPVEVTTGGTLSGNGTTGAITVPSAGVVSPGDGWGADRSGILTADGNVTLGPTSSVFLNLIGNGTVAGGTQQPGTHYDQLYVDGNVTIQPGASLSGLVDTTTVKLSNRFVVVRATGTVSGTFAELSTSPGFVFVDGYKFDISYIVDPSTGDNLVVLDKVQVVTTTGLTSSNDFGGTSGSPSTLNQQVTFTATVRAEDGSRVPPPGTTFVQFFQDLGSGRTPLGTPVAISAGGVAVLTVPFTTAGTRTITADYLGDADNFAVSTSNPLTQIVQQPAVSIQSATPVPAPISPNNSPGSNDILSLSVQVTGELSAYTPTLVVTGSSGEVRRVQLSPATTPATPPFPGFTVGRAFSASTTTFTTTWDGKNNGGGFVADGDYQVTITALDERGNVFTSAAVTVRVDNTNPAATGSVGAPVINPGTATPPPPATTTFTATITDTNLGTWAVTVTDSVGTPVKLFTGTGPNVSVTWDGTNAANAPVPDGRYTLTLVATDAAGNTNTATSPVVTTVYVIRTAPTVTLTSGLGAGVADAATTYGDAVTLTAVVALPAFVQPADATSLLSGKPVTFSFPGTTTLTSNLAFVPARNRFEAAVEVPLNLPAGRYTPITGTFPATSELPTATDGDDHTVNRAPLRVTGLNASRPYAESNPVFGYTVNAADLKVQYGDTEAVVTGLPSTQATVSSNAGTRAIERGSVSALPNYDVVFTNGTLTITPVALTIRVNDATRARFADEPPFTASFDGFKLSDSPAVVSNLNLVTNAVKNSPIGTYSIFSATTPTATNYSPIRVEPGTLTVTGSPTVTVVGSGKGSPPQAQVLSPSGERLENFPFPATFAGGIRTATGDFNKDGIADYVLGSGPGVLSFVQIISGADGATLFQAVPFENFTGGTFVAAGDMTGDGVAELVVTPDEGGGPRVVIYRGGDFEPIVSYFAIDDAAFRGGVRPAVGDLDGDGFADLAVSAGFGGGPRISLWDGEKLGKKEFVNLIPDFFAFEDTLRNGAFVSIGDVTGDGIGDLMVGAGPGGGPRVKGYNGTSLLSVGGDAAEVFANFFAGDVNNRGGVKVVAKNLDGDRFIDVVTGGGEGDKAVATAYRGSVLATNGASLLYEFDLDGTLNGVFVG